MDNREWRERAAKCSERIAKEFGKGKFADTMEAIYEKTLEENFTR